MNTDNNKEDDGASDSTLEMIGQLQNMSTGNKDNNISICANCGKEGDDVNNICNKCKKSTYCNAACKKKHRYMHKKECEEHTRLATARHNKELRLAAELHDEKLFKQPPQLEDCPICFERIPILDTGSKYMVCCGKIICSGCVYAPLYDSQGNEVDNQKCPFCRKSWPESDKEMNKMRKKRIETGDAKAIDIEGCCYSDGTCEHPKDYKRAFELYRRAADLGYSESYYSIGHAYANGKGVKRDKKKARHYYELAAIRGSVLARFYLGLDEKKTGSMDRALKHFMIAVRGGDDESLQEIKKIYTKGHAAKEDYMKALQDYQEYLGEIKSDQRDKAAAFSDDYRYY